VAALVAIGTVFYTLQFNNNVTPLLIDFDFYGFICKFVLNFHSSVPFFVGEAKLEQKMGIKILPK
jgi:hypothetical protein